MPSPVPPKVSGVFLHDAGYVNEGALRLLAKPPDAEERLHRIDMQFVAPPGLRGLGPVRSGKRI